VSVTSIFDSALVQCTLATQLALVIVIDIVVLPRDRIGEHARTDAGIAHSFEWTLLRHFRSAGPVARLPRGVSTSASARALVPSVARSLRLAARCARAPRAAVRLAAIASKTDRGQCVAAPAVEQARALVLVFADGDG